MEEKKLMEIYDTIIPMIKKHFDNSSFDYEQAYQQYLKEKYGEIMKAFVSEEDEETVNLITASYIEDEKRFWEKLSKKEILVYLDKDPAFEYLTFLSEAAFAQAKTCVETGVFLSDEEDYNEKFGELASCLDDIKVHNIDAAKVVLSEAILDVEYAFKKSDVKSLRLARWQ